MTTENKTCRVCGVGLDSRNWPPSRQKSNRRICRGCDTTQNRLWRKANPEKQKAISTRQHRKQGQRPFDQNKECSQFLGVHIAERVLSHVFKDVKRMPINNPGYDVICNRDMKIDIKSSCLWKNGTTTSWSFHINRNTIADFFLCLAFDNRKDLNPLHAWLIPGSKLNCHGIVGISQGTIPKWAEYRLDISKISECCDKIRGV